MSDAVFEKATQIARVALSKDENARVNVYKQELRLMGITTTAQLTERAEDMRQGMEEMITDMYNALAQNQLEDENDEYRNVLPQPSSTREE